MEDRLEICKEVTFTFHQLKIPPSIDHYSHHRDRDGAGAQSFQLGAIGDRRSPDEGG